MSAVLVVDDDADIRDGLREILEDAGHTVSEARNGKDALAALRAAASLPDIILLDLMMPVMDGFEFRRKQLLDARLAAVPVVVLSADVHVGERAGALGNALWLRKPIHLDQLLDVVARHAITGP